MGRTTRWKADKTRRRGEVADHNVVSGEVRGRDDDLKGDGLGQRLFDRKPGGGDQRGTLTSGRSGGANAGRSAGVRLSSTGRRRRRS